MMTAFSFGFTRSMRAMAASTSSRGLALRWRTSSACAVASRRASSSLIGPRYATSARRFPPAPPALAGASAVRLTRHMTFDGQQQHPLEGTHVLVTRDDDLVGARGVRLQRESGPRKPLPRSDAHQDDSVYRFAIPLGGLLH